MKIIYNVTVCIDASVHDEWLDWMRTIHIPEVMATGHFLENRMCKVLVEEDSGITYSIQYTCAGMPDLEAYQQKHAPRLQKDHNERYKDKFVAFRTLLEVLE
ncbi:MAG TPA: DUF4286 family protein [Bacteroidia bacterium]|jgi:hypothetical protein|nr:DUF4286 family protein [Bacteroidia bacterium]